MYGPSYCWHFAFGATGSKGVVCADDAASDWLAVLLPELIDSATV